MCPVAPVRKQAPARPVSPPKQQTNTSHSFSNSRTLPLNVARGAGGFSLLTSPEFNDKSTTKFASTFSLCDVEGGRGEAAAGEGGEGVGGWSQVHPGVKPPPRHKRKCRVCF